MQASDGRSRARFIILCADDYGMNAGVSGAILDLAAAGRISATSCMTNAPGWRQAARDLPAGDGGLAVGLHLVLTWGQPIGPMPGFGTPSGGLPTLAAVIGRALTRRLPRSEIRAEIGRQLDAFEAALGRVPDFVDGHQHVHALPGIRDELLAVLTRRGLAGRVWLRDPCDRPAAIWARRLSAGKALVVNVLAAGFGARARAAGFTTNEGFSGFSPFDSARDPGADFARYLVRLGRAPLVMCHPGRPDPERNADEIAAARVWEYEYFASPAFTEELARAGVTLRELPSPWRGRVGGGGPFAESPEVPPARPPPRSDAPHPLGPPRQGEGRGAVPVASGDLPDEGAGRPPP